MPVYAVHIYLERDAGVHQNATDALRSNTASRCCGGDADISVLSPSRTPLVLHEPVRRRTLEFKKVWIQVLLLMAYVQVQVMDDRWQTEAQVKLEFRFN